MSSNQPIFRVWKTVRVEEKSRDALIATLESCGFKIGERARNMMSRQAFVVPSEPYVIDLAKMTVAEIGFTRRTSTRELWARITAIGGMISAPVVGPYVRLADAEQPSDEIYRVVTEQIRDSNEYPRIFEVSHISGERSLNGYVANSINEWAPSDVVAIEIPRRKPIAA